MSGSLTWSNLPILAATAQKAYPEPTLINCQFRSDLLWWNTFLSSWKGTSMPFESKANQPDEELWNDASGSWGCRVLWGGEWFQQSWVNISQGKPGMDSIAPMELLLIVIAAAIWSPKWAGCTMCSNCDNEAVVSVINSGHCEHKLMMHHVMYLSSLWLSIISYW